MTSILAENLEKHLFDKARAAIETAQAEMRYKTQIFPRIKGLTDEQWLNHVAAAAGCAPKDAIHLASIGCHKPTKYVAREPTFTNHPPGTMLTWKSYSNWKTYYSAVVMEKGCVIQVKSMVDGEYEYHVDKCYCAACWLYLHDGERRPFKTLIYDDEYAWRKTLDMDGGSIAITPTPSVT